MSYLNSGQKKDCRKMNLQKKFMLQDKQYLVGKMEKQSPIQKRYNYFQVFLMFPSIHF